MLIDWVTARCPVLDLDESSRARLLALNDRIMRLDPATGEMRWQTAAWDSVRSDSHQIAVRCVSDFWMQGSPARVLGDGCSVFGSGPSAALDLAGCVDAMRRFVAHRVGVILPSAEKWTVSRVDVTGNLLMDSLADVRQALAILRECEGGRYRVSQQAGDTVYWSHRSQLRAGKAYAKGPHLRHLSKQKTYTGRSYSEDDVMLASRLLRLELRLGRQFFHRNDWRELKAEELVREWESYFARMVGDAAMTSEGDVFDRIKAAAPTEGQARAAYGLWLLIQECGWERAKDATSRRTFYRNIRILRNAGFGDADISAGRVVPLRRRILEARVVRSWDELKAA